MAKQVGKIANYKSKHCTNTQQSVIVFYMALCLFFILVLLDFSLTPAAATTITFAALSAIPSSACISVSATDDDIVEGTEDFDFVLTMTDQMPDVVVGTSATTDVTIPANDGMLFVWITRG